MLNVGSDTGQPSPKDHGAPNSALDDGTDVEHPLPKRQSILNSTLGVHDNGSQPPPKKTKKEVDSVDPVLKPGIKHERLSSQIKSEEGNKHNDAAISTSKIPVRQSNAPPFFKQEAT